MNRLLSLWSAALLALVFDAAAQGTNPLRITCPPNQTNWHCGVASTAVVTYPAPTTTAGCPTNAVVTCTPPSGAVFILGTTPVTCRATNSCRESAVCTFTVTVARDTVPPAIQCPTNRMVWLCTLVPPDARVSWPPPTATDNADTNVTVTCSPPSGSLFPPGTTTVTCTATDDCTNSTTCNFTVTVARDTTKPTITCPASINIVACSASGAVATYPTPTATDNADSDVAVTCIPASGSLFPLGTTTVTCTATDDCTNSTTCTFLVRVTRDTTPPVLQPCPSNIVLLACDRSGAIVNYPTPTATDNLDPAPVVTCSPASGTRFPPGTTTVTCTATDACTNRGTCTFTVTVNADTTPPVIQCPSNIVLWTCSTSAITHFGVTATDDYDLDVKIACAPPVGTPLPVGNTTVRCVAEDDCGNTNQCSFQVQVNRDTSPPAIECPSNMVFNCVCPGNTIVLDFFKPTVTDNHDPNPTVVCVPPSLVSSPGVHPVVCTATDNCGNSNRCTFTVTFSYDTTPPALVCPTNMTVWTCDTSTVVNYSVTATDACDATVDIVCTPPSGSVFPLGTSVVVCTATDNCTNRSTCTFTVTVRPRLLYGGLCHTPLGLAALNVNANDELEVSGLGASGQDGVRIDLGESQGLRWLMRLPSSSDVDGRDFLIWQRHMGSSPAGNEILISEMAYASRNGRRTVTPSAASYKLKLMLRGEVVYQQGGQTGEIEIPECHHVQQEHCVGEEFEDLNPNLPYCISFLTIECDWDTPSGPVRADALVVTPEDPLPPFMSVSAIEILGSDFPALTLRSERLLMFGSREQPSLPHRALGQTRLVAENGALKMAGLGSTGGGVGIDLDSLAGPGDQSRSEDGIGDGYMDEDFPPWVIDPGMEFEMTARTSVSVACPDSALGGLTLSAIRANLAEVSIRCRPCESWLPPTFTVYQAGQPVGGAILTGSGPLATLEPVGPDRPRLVGSARLPSHPLGFMLHFSGPAVFTLRDGTRLTGDEIRVLADTATPVAAEPASLELTARGVEAFTITSETLLRKLRLACPPDRTVRTCSSSPAPVSFPPPTVTGGNCSAPPVVVCVPPSGSLFPPGTTTVVCTATNVCGERAVCSFSVTVLADTTPPVIQCPSNMVFNCLCPGTIINLDFFQATATDDQDPNPTIVCVPPSLVSSPGVHVVTCAATDNCGNSNRCSFTVTFNYDTTPPDLTCSTNMTVWTCDTSTLVNYAVTATDACDATVDLVCTPPSGSVFPVGTRTVVCTATDNCTNRSACTFTVTVHRDTTPPVLQCPANFTILTCTNFAVVDYGVVATDDCDAAVDVVCAPPSGSRLPLGVTMVTCVARDDCGHTSTCTFDVSVRASVPRLSIVAAAGGILLSWSDGAELEEAEDVKGPWRVDPDARSPHRVSASRGQRFFRLAARGDGNGTKTFCPGGEETNPRLTDVLSRMHYASTHVREEFEEYEDVSETPPTNTHPARVPAYDPRPGTGYSWNSAVGRRFLLDIGDVGEDREGAASHVHGSIEHQIVQGVESPYCVDPDYYVEAGDRVFSGWSEMTFQAPKNAFATKAEAEAFLLKIHAEQPFFLPFTHPDVRLGQGWYYDSGKLHRACDYSRTGVEENEDPTFIVTSAGSGVVVATDWDGNGGNYVAVESTAPGGQKVMFIYLHLRDGKSHDVAKAKSSTSMDEKYVKYRAFANDYPDHLSWGTDEHTIKVQVGDHVSIGTPLAWAGNTGAGGAGSGLNEDGSPKNWKGNLHLHVYVAVPHPNVQDTWVWVDPYGVYQEDDTGCYDLLKDTKFSRLYAPFYSTFHGVPYEVFKFYWGYYPNMGMKLRTLSIHRDGNSLLASGSFQSGIPGGWYLHTYRTIDEFQDLANQRYNQGYIMRETTVEKTLGGQPRYSAIWRPLEPGESIEHRSQLTDAQWSDLWQDRVVGDEWRLEDYFGYAVGGVNYHSAFVTSHQGRPFVYSGLLSSSELDDKIDEYKGDGYLPVSFNAASRVSGLRFSGIFRDLPGCWKVRWGLTPAGYQSYVSQQIQLGYRVWKVQGYSGSDRYGVVLHDPTGPCQ